MTDGGPSANPERGIVTVDHPMLAGHFPGHPIVPGAWLLAWVVCRGGTAFIGDRRIALDSGIKRVKFLRPLAPDCPFECTLDPASRNDTMRFAVISNGGIIAEGSLQLQQQAEPAQ